MLTSRTNLTNILQSLVELLGDWLDSESIVLEKSLAGIEFSKEDSENIHTEMATAAMNTFLSKWKFQMYDSQMNELEIFGYSELRELAERHGFADLDLEVVEYPENYDFENGIPKFLFDSKSKCLYWDCTADMDDIHYFKPVLRGTSVPVTAL